MTASVPPSYERDLLDQPAGSLEAQRHTSRVQESLTDTDDFRKINPLLATTPANDEVFPGIQHLVRKIENQRTHHAEPEKCHESDEQEIGRGCVAYSAKRVPDH